MARDILQISTATTRRWIRLLETAVVTIDPSADTESDAVTEDAADGSRGRKCNKRIYDV